MAASGAADAAATALVAADAAVLDAPMKVVMDAGTVAAVVLLR